MQSISPQAIIDAVGSGLVVLDGELTVAFASRSFYDLFAVTPEEALGRRLYDLGRQYWDTQTVRRFLEKAVSDREGIDGYEVEHAFPGARRRIIALNARKLRRESNHGEHILVTFSDVTEGRGQALGSTAAGRSIIDAIPDPLLVLDQDLRITTASRNFLRVFGDGDAIGKALAGLMQGQWDVEALKLKLQRVIPDAAPVENFLVEDDFPGLGRRVFKLNARGIEATAGRGPEILVIFEDVTQAVAADRHKDLRAAELAHRIKNSLSVISAFLTLEISRGPAPCRDGYQAMQTRLTAVASLYDLIARSSSLGPVDMRAYLRGIGNGLRASLIGRNGTIEIAVDAEPLAIDADHAVSVGLLVNELATNAIKHAFPLARGRIVLGFRRGEGGAVLSVRDDGIGLDAAAGPEANTGMGMRFVDAFVRELRGSLSRASGPDGTTVTVQLPFSILAA